MYGNNIFLAGANGGTSGTSRVMRSSDGISWTNSEPTSNTQLKYQSILTYKKQFIFLGMPNSGSIFKYLGYTANGQTWNEFVTAAGGRSFVSLAARP